MDQTKHITIVGGGLAGSESAWQAAERGLRVCLYEMRPELSTGAHHTSSLAELVCSNSLGSTLPDHASGILINELRKLNSLVLSCAEETRLPAGSALAVDRDRFAQLVTSRISNHPNIELIRKEITEIPQGPTIIASGPLTSEKLANNIAALTGKQYLYFFDAVSPIVIAETINMDLAFRGSRYSKGDTDEGDYINCPLMESEYNRFVDALISAKTISLRRFENEIRTGVRTGTSQFFEGCLPIEVLASRDRQALAFGPLRPVGLTDKHTGNHPYAIVQLRQDNQDGSLYNMVGFQTNLTYREQKQVFRLIPGLENAEFSRLGQMHRNTYLSAPILLRASLQYHEIPDLFFAGQIAGVEGYLGNIATGLLAGINIARYMNGKDAVTFPPTTMLGALCQAITQADPEYFQPIKANFGILPPLQLSKRVGKRERAELFSTRAARDFDFFITHIND